MMDGELYALAVHFKAARLWDRLKADQLVALQPEKGERLYLSITGQEGRRCALSVYPGKKGLASYFALLAGDPDGIYLLNCLQCSFEDRQMLRKPDLDQIKALGLSFRGRNQWPLFRRFIPFFLPWYLRPAEQKTMAVALHGALFYAQAESSYPQDGHIPLLRQEGEQFKLELAPMPSSPSVAYPSLRLYDELMLQRLRRLPLSQDTTWEVGIRIFQKCMEGKPPYYPVVMMIVKRENSQIVTSELVTDYYKECGLLVDAFLNAMQREKLRPARLCLGDPRARTLLWELCQQMGVDCESIQQPRLLADVFHSLNHFID